MSMPASCRQHLLWEQMDFDVEFMRELKRREESYKANVARNKFVTKVLAAHEGYPWEHHIESLVFVVQWCGEFKFRPER